jgi:predicted nucleotide-binding protein (sugar kinase/HSP70/actin superfamily)
MERYHVTFPHIGNYCIPIETFFRNGLNTEYVIPPPVTRRTLELGSKYSPDYVCAPFKYCLGNYIESIEAGADTLVQTGGACRLGYYGELHEQILQDLGYKVRFVNVDMRGRLKAVNYYNAFKEINPEISVQQIAMILPTVFKMVECIDEAEDYIRRNIGFEKKQGIMNSLHEQYLQDFRGLDNVKAVREKHAAFMKNLQAVEIEKPSNPLKIGIIGEYYTIMEPFSNHFLEKELAEMGIVIDRWMNFTHSLLKKSKNKIRRSIRAYARYDMGATSMSTIAKALDYAKSGYDGIIHVKSFGCTPETDAIPVLLNIHKDYKIPILYLSFDTQTSETGIKTRLEAFYDMIIMIRKDKKQHERVSRT